jgi:hypothetical protein
MEEIMIKDEKEEKWLSDLKPGDKIAIIFTNCGSVSRITYSTVKKILPTGVIVAETGERFRPDGSEKKTRTRQDMGYHTVIEPISEKTNIWKRTNRARSIILTTDIKNLPLEKLEAIAKIIREPIIPERNQGDQGNCRGSTGEEP